MTIWHGTVASSGKKQLFRDKNTFICKHTDMTPNPLLALNGESITIHLIERITDSIELIKGRYGRSCLRFLTFANVVQNFEYISKKHQKFKNLFHRFLKSSFCKKFPKFDSL